MCGALADPMSERFKTLTDGHNESEWDRRAVDPLSSEVLGLQAGMRRHLEEVRSEHGVLVRSNALRLVRRRKRSNVGVLDDLQLVLLILVEETIEG